VSSYLRTCPHRMEAADSLLPCVEPASGPCCDKLFTVGSVKLNCAQK
jgi:hypothetical protein